MARRRRKPLVNVRQAGTFAIQEDRGRVVVAKTFGRFRLGTIGLEEGYPHQVVDLELPLIVRGIVESRDGATLALGGFGGEVALLDAETLQPREVLPGPGRGELQDLKALPEGLAVGTWRDVRVLDPATGRELGRIDLGSDFFQPPSFGDLAVWNDRLVVSWSAWPAGDRQVRAISVFAWPGLEEVERFEHDVEVVRMALRPGTADLLLFDGHPVELTWFSLQSGRVTGHLHRDEDATWFNRAQPSFLDSETVAVCAGPDVLIWDLAAGAVSHRLPYGTAGGPVQVGWLGDGARIVAASDDNVRIYAGFFSLTKCAGSQVSDRIS